MPSTGHFLAFALTSFALIVVPGPSVLFVVSRAVTLGRRAGLATVVGNATGLYVQVMAVSLGVGAIVEQSIAAFTIIKLAGAAYLIYLGVQAIRHRRSLAQALNVAIEPKATRRILLDDFVVGISNPKAIILFAAILPQFIDRSAGHVPLQLFLLGLVSIAIALVSDGMWALAAGTARSWLARSPRRLELLGGTGGLVMIGLGARLAFTGRND
jgi:threonine/homoserine/homoserine lactone efflux protein